jgi:hypothetical protein
MLDASWFFDDMKNWMQFDLFLHRARGRLKARRAGLRLLQTLLRKKEGES